MIRLIIRLLTMIFMILIYSTASKAASCISTESALDQALFVQKNIELCPSTTIQLTNPVMFMMDNQVIETLNNPSGSTRAILQLSGRDDWKGCPLLTAIMTPLMKLSALENSSLYPLPANYGDPASYSISLRNNVSAQNKPYQLTGVHINNVQIDGNPGSYGMVRSADLPSSCTEAASSSNDPFIVGNSNPGLVQIQRASGTTISDSVVFHSRSWSHIVLSNIGWNSADYAPYGIPYGETCVNSLITGNTVGPSTSFINVPSSTTISGSNRQFFTPIVGSDDWENSDGISVSCPYSTISNNYVEDVTDGGIVIFAAPNPADNSTSIKTNNVTVSGNTVASINSDMNEGIGLVDWDYECGYGGEGNFSGVNISNNIIEGYSQGEMLLGIAVGSRILSGPNVIYNQGCTSSGPAALQNGYSPVEGRLNIASSTVEGGSVGFGVPISGVDQVYFSSNTLTGANDTIADSYYIPYASGLPSNTQYVSQNSLDYAAARAQLLIVLIRYLTNSQNSDPVTLLSTLQLLTSYVGTDGGSCVQSSGNTPGSMANFVTDFISNTASGYLNSGQISSKQIVINLYLLILQRAPDSNGLSYFTNYINGSSSFSQGAIGAEQAIFASSEYTGSGFGCVPTRLYPGE